MRSDKLIPSTSGIPNKPQMPQPEFNKATSHADRMILEAEHFQAVIAAPPEGTSDHLVLSKQFGQGCGLSDDEFFHLTCHINKNTQEKIERGDFVDLEKLVPKDHFA